MITLAFKVPQQIPKYVRKEVADEPLASTICAVAVWIPCQGNVEMLTRIFWSDLKLHCSFWIKWLVRIKTRMLSLAGLHVPCSLKDNPAGQEHTTSMLKLC